MTTESGSHGPAPARVLVVQNAERAPLDRLGEWLTGVAVDVVRPYLGEPIPSSLPDGLIVLGGGMSANDDDVAPWLVQVRDLLALAVAESVPTLGICLGCQLLAAACGGAVDTWASAGWEMGVIDVRWREEARTDPLVRSLPDPYRGPSMHRDAVRSLPPGAVWLAASAMYPYQAFRVGDAAWGLQFHPEASFERFQYWPELVPETDPEAIRARYRAYEPDIATAGAALARQFSALVVEAGHRRTQARSEEGATT